MSRRPGPRFNRRLPAQPRVVSSAAVTTNASALIGAWTTANSFNSAAGQGFDMVLDSMGYITFEHDATWPTGEDLLSCQSSSSDGWFINLGSGIGAFFRRGVGGGSSTFSPDVYTGLHTLAWWRTPGGALRASFDGGAAAQLSAAPAFTVAGAASVICVGYNLTETATTRVSTATKIVCFGFINGGSDADLVAISGNVNTLTRWDHPPAAVAHAGIVSGHHAKDWDGSAATWVASIGSAPKTCTKRGTGGTKATLAAMQRWPLPQANWNDNSQYLASEVTPVAHVATGTFAWQQIAHSGDRSWLEVLSSISVALAENWNAGVDVDGTQVQTRRNRVAGGVAVFPANIITVRDVPTQTAAAHTYKITAGIQSKAGSGNLEGVFPQAVWVPVGTTPTWTVQSAPTNRIVVLGDSIPEQVAGTAANITTPCTQAWTMRARANGAAGSWRITTKVWGSRQWSYNITTSGGRQTLADELAVLCDGTVKNIVYLEPSTNDWGLNGGYTVEATFIADLSDFIVKLIAATAGKPGIKILLQSPIHRTGEATLNASGTGMALIAVANSFSHAMAVVQAANPTIVLVDGAAMVTTPGGYDADLTHLAPGNPGHTEFEINFRALPDLGY